jgi:hypothetical protein
MSSSQRSLPTQDSTTLKAKTNIHALNGIQSHDLSFQAIKAYASDRAATGTGYKATTFTYLRHPLLVCVVSLSMGGIYLPVDTLHTRLYTQHTVPPLVHNIISTTIFENNTLLLSLLL